MLALYDPAGDNCGRGETCVQWFESTLNYKFPTDDQMASGDYEGVTQVTYYARDGDTIQTCQVCDSALSTAEYFDTLAPGYESPMDDDFDPSEVPEPTPDDELINAVNEEFLSQSDQEDPYKYTVFLCLNAKSMVASAGVLAATMAMLY